MTFEELQDRAERVFYSFWIEEGTPEECKFYAEPEQTRRGVILGNKKIYH